MRRFESGGRKPLAPDAPRPELVHSKWRRPLSGAATLDASGARQALAAATGDDGVVVLGRQAVVSLGDEERDAGPPRQHGPRRWNLAGHKRDASVQPLMRDAPERTAGSSQAGLGCPR